MCNIFMYICTYIHILCQHSDLFPVSLQMESARKAWENSPNVREKGSPVTSTAPPIASGVSSSASGPSGANYNSFSSASMPQIPVASVTPTTSLSGGKSLCPLRTFSSCQCLRVAFCLLSPKTVLLAKDVRL